MQGKKNPHNLSSFFSSKSARPSSTTSPDSPAQSGVFNTSTSSHQDPFSPPPPPKTEMPNNRPNNPFRSAKGDEDSSKRREGAKKNMFSEVSDEDPAPSKTQKKKETRSNSDPLGGLSDKEPQAFRSDSTASVPDQFRPTGMPLPKFSGFLPDKPPLLPATVTGVHDLSDSNGNSARPDKRSQSLRPAYQWNPYDDDEERDEEEEVVSKWKRRQQKEKEERKKEKESKPKESTAQKIKRKASSFFFGNGAENAAHHSVAHMLTKGGASDSDRPPEEEPMMARRVSSVMRSFRFGRSANSFHVVGNDEPEPPVENEEDEEEEDQTESQMQQLRQNRRSEDPFYVAGVPMFDSPASSPDNSPKELPLQPQLNGVSVAGAGKKKSFSVKTQSARRINSSLAYNNSVPSSKDNRSRQALSRKQSTYSVSANRNQSMFGRNKSVANLQGTNKVTVDLEADMEVEALIDEVLVQEAELESMAASPKNVAVQTEDYMPIMWTTRQFQHNMARAVVSKNLERFSQLLFLYSLLKKQQEFCLENNIPQTLRIVLLAEEERVICKGIHENYREQEAHTYNCQSILDQVLDPETGYTLMHLCVLAQKHGILQECLRFGTQPHEVRDLQGDTPLTLAMKRFPTAAPVLFSLGKDIDLTRPCGPWVHTSTEEDHNGEIQTQNLLFSCVDADDKTPAWPGRLTFIRHLVEKQGLRASQEDFLGFTPSLWALQHASFLGKPEKVDEIIRYLKKMARAEKTQDTLRRYTVKRDEGSNDFEATDDLAPDTIVDPSGPTPGQIDVSLGRDNKNKRRNSTGAPTFQSKYSPSVMALAEALSLDPSSSARINEAKMKEIPRMPLFISSVDSIRRVIQGPILRIAAVLLLLVFHIVEYALFVTPDYSPHLKLEVWAKAVGIIAVNWNGLPFFLGLIRVGFLVVGATVGCLFSYYFVARLLGAKLLKLPALGAQSEAELRYYGGMFGPYMAKIYNPRTRSRIFTVTVGIVMGLYAGALGFNAVCTHVWASQSGWALLEPYIGNVHPILSMYILMAISLGLDWYALLFICDLMYQQGALSIFVPHFTFSNFANVIDLNMRRLLLGPTPYLLDPRKRAISEVDGSDVEEVEMKFKEKVEKERQKEINKQLKQLKEMRNMPVMDIESFRIFAFWIFLSIGWLIIIVAFILLGVLVERDYDSFYYADYKVSVNTTKACACILFGSFAILMLCIIPLQEWSWPTFQKNPYLALPGMSGSTHHAWFLMLVFFALMTTDMQNIIEHVKMVWAVSDSQSSKISSICCCIPALVGIVFFLAAFLSTSLHWAKQPMQAYFLEPTKKRLLLTRLWQSCAYGAHMYAVPVPNAVSLLYQKVPDLPEWEALHENRHEELSENTIPDVAQVRRYGEDRKEGQPAIKSVAHRFTARKRRRIAVVRVLDLLTSKHLLVPIKELAENGRGGVVDEDSDYDVKEETEYWRGIAKQQNKQIRENMREAVRANKEKLEAKKEDYTNPLLGETDVGSEQSGTSKGKKDKTTSREAPTPWDQKKGEETIVVFENPLKKKEPTILAKGTALRDGERDPLNFNTLYGMRVVVLRRRNYMRERQIMYQVELLAFVGDTNRSRRRVMKFRKKEEKYMRALNAS